MRITINGSSAVIKRAETELVQACEGRAKIEILAKGDERNLAGEPSTFLTVGIHYGADLVVGILAHYIYDLIAKGHLTAKINGRDVSNLPQDKIERIIQQESATEDAKAEPPAT